MILNYERHLKSWIVMEFLLLHDVSRDGLAGFGRFGGFEGSIRQLRARRKGKTWPATAHSLATPRDGLAGFGWFGGCGGFERSEGNIRQFRAIVWQLQEPVWQVSEGLDGLKEASGIVEPIKTKDGAVWQLQELEEPDKMKSTPKVVPGAAPAMAKAGVEGQFL